MSRDLWSAPRSTADREPRAVVFASFSRISNHPSGRFLRTGSEELSPYRGGVREGGLGPSHTGCSLRLPFPDVASDAATREPWLRARGARGQRGARRAAHTSISGLGLCGLRASGMPLRRARVQRTRRRRRSGLLRLRIGVPGILFGMSALLGRSMLAQASRWPSGLPRRPQRTLVKVTRRLPVLSGLLPNGCAFMRRAK